MKASEISSNMDLQNYIGYGNKVKYIFFWGHRPNKDGSIGKTCFSQWFDVRFELEEVIYRSAEHYMMAEKAKLFEDIDVYQKIIEAKHPGEVKRLGREVKGFDEEIWKKERFGIVVNGNVAKFSQDRKLKEYLLGTGERVLVEASPVDKIWGVGLAATDHEVENPYKWKGLNLLGYALMQARLKIQEPSKSS